MDDDVLDRLQSCLRMTEAVLDAMDSAMRESDSSDTWRFASYRTYLHKSNELVLMANAIEPIAAPIDVFDMEKVPTVGNTIGVTQRTYFETARTNLQILKAYLANRIDPKEKRIAGIADFLQANLRRAMLAQPEREREVQDSIEQLLIGRGLEKGLDYDREVGRVKVSSKEVIPDFILPPLDTAIEVKLLKNRTQVGPMIDEVNADIQAYLQGYKALVVVVYDLGVLRDELEFRRDLEAIEGVKVIVVKH